eukprot:11187112-Lingulodinium_polyedra.AAC.1
MALCCARSGSRPCGSVARPSTTPPCRGGPSMRAPPCEPSTTSRSRPCGSLAWPSATPPGRCGPDA